MTHGTSTHQDDGKASQPGFVLADLWVVPLLLLAHVFAFFTDQAGKLKAMRRRPLPKDWRKAVPGLLTGEWHIRDAIREGVEALLKGEELDIAAILNAEIAHIPARPADLHIPEPKSAWETHRRFEAIARFYADPETFIRRAAQRIASQTASAGVAGVSETGLAGAGVAGVIEIPDSGVRLQPDARIRAPPHTPFSGLEIHQISAPQSPAGTRARVQRPPNATPYSQLPVPGAQRPSSPRRTTLDPSRPNGPETTDKTDA